MYSDGVMLNGNIITHNIADNTLYPSCESDFAAVGGGLFLDFDNNVTLTNNLIIDNHLNNQVNSQGSGLYIRASSVRLLHSTIAHNSGGDGSGIYVIPIAAPKTINKRLLGPVFISDIWFLTQQLV